MGAESKPSKEEAGARENMPAVYVGYLVNKKYVMLKQPDYFYSADGKLGIKLGGLAELAMSGARAAVLWVEPVRVPLSESSEADAGRRIYASGNVAIDYVRREVFVNDEPAGMQNQEFNVLEYLSGNEGRELTRDDITLACWGHEHLSNRTLNVHICNIRHKIRPYGSLIKTIHGTGYMFQDVPPAEETENPADQEV